MNCLTSALALVSTVHYLVRLMLMTNLVEQLLARSSVAVR